MIGAIVVGIAADYIGRLSLPATSPRSGGA
jgi:hypothetical protein